MRCIKRYLELYATTGTLPSLLFQGEAVKLKLVCTTSDSFTCFFLEPLLLVCLQERGELGQDLAAAEVVHRDLDQIDGIQMESKEESKDNPFRDLTNISTTDKAHEGITDQKEHKRQVARERYSNMPTEKKAELLKRRRESYYSKKFTSPVQNDDRVQSCPRAMEMSSTLPELLELGLASTERGSQSVVVQPCSLTCNKENIPPQSVTSAQGTNFLTPSIGRANLL